MQTVHNPFGGAFADLKFPDKVDVISMNPAPAIKNPKSAISNALEFPIGTPSLREIALSKKIQKNNATCTILVSDNTRPVPYVGNQGILLPAIEVLLACGYKAEEILILIATGTHRPMSDEEIAVMIDRRVLKMGIKVVNHDSTDEKTLRNIGSTKRGTPMMLDTRYLDADLKIGTGLVESHFMAGASGGRKSICPGIIGKQSTFIFHGPDFMVHEKATDLVLEGNPVHEESLEIAKAATMDFCMNVTVDHAFRPTGIFFGELEKAHLAAVEFLKQSVNVPVEHRADVVITHAGFVGINHYQAGKCAVTALRVLRRGGFLVIIADMTDEKAVIGGLTYRANLSLLKLIGSENYLKLIRSPDWTFIPDQWQVQEWGKVFAHIPMDHMIMYSPRIDKFWWSELPGINGQDIMKSDGALSPDCYTRFIGEAISYISEKTERSADDLDIAYIADGPYAVPRIMGE